MKRTLYLTAGLLLLLAFNLHTASAQVSPPLGPPSNHTEDHELPVAILINQVRQTAQGIVDSTNNKYQSQGKDIRVQLTSVDTYQPFISATQFTDRPNQNYVDVMMAVTINVSIPYASDRQVYIPLDINVFCDGWQTSQGGEIKIVATPGPPSVEGGNILEDILQVRDYIDNQVKSNLTGISATTQSLPISRCATIGAVTSPDVTFSAIAFDPPVQHRVIVGLPATTFMPTIQVTFLHLKRLTARGNGGVLYNPVENIILGTYADFTYRQSAVLTMQEGDDVALNLAPVTLTPPLFDSFVMIANISQQPGGQPEDSSFDVSQASANYAPGVHTVQIAKQYWLPPSPWNRKPIKVTVPAYELTYNLSYNDGKLQSKVQ